MNISTDMLRTFVAAADSESYSTSAKIVHRSQSAVSMQMKRLEEVVGCSLFKRDGHTMKLTSEGHTLIWYARRVLKLYDEAIAALTQPELSGTVKLGAPEDYADRQLPLVLSRFAKAFPHIQLEVFCQPYKILQEALDNNELDLLVQTNSEVPDKGVAICYEQVVWVTSKKDLVHEQNPVPLALYCPDCIFREWATKSLQGAGCDYRIAYTSPSVSGLLAAVKGGLAIAAVGRSSVPNDLRILGPTDGFPELPKAVISLVKTPKPLSKAAESLATYIQESFKDMVDD